MNEKFEEIKEENAIIVIYFILLFTYLYANKIEVDYLNYQKEEDKEKYRLLLYLVFGISFVITLYYVIESINSLKIYEQEDINKLKKLSLIANILVLIATGIYIYIIYKDKDINLEVSP
ncbi:MAG: hypothetical protein IJE89_04030 [Bacilli bacterium]|nr:hypothetical protein [Bacilli bacterium]